MFLPKVKQRQNEQAKYNQKAMYENSRGMGETTRRTKDYSPELLKLAFICMLGILAPLNLLIMQKSSIP